MTEAYDKVLLRMLFDWSERPDDMILEEELLKIQAIVEAAVDEHYGDDTTLDLTTVTHEGKLAIGAEEPGWTVDPDLLWVPIPESWED